MKLPFSEAFEVLQERDEHFEKITQETYPSNIISAQILIIALFSFCYGLIMGSYNSWMQAISSGAKLTSLLFLTLIICFPSFYIVQLVLGSKVKIKQLAVMMLSGFLMTTTIMLAFAPIVLLFQLSGDNYNFLKFLHVGVFIFSGFFGMRAVLDALKNSFAEQGVYPQIGLSIFRVWVIIFAFVGIQLAWNLRPFVGYKDMPYELLRKDTQGNFYSSMMNSLGEMMGGPNMQRKKGANQDDSPEKPQSDPPKKPKETKQEKPPTETIESTQNDSLKND
ncbi:MAG: hypothetical protein AB8F94_20960 [Saprospiraceae bacterium]